MQRNAGVPNARLRGQQLLEHCALEPATRLRLQELAQGLELTARGVHRLLRVARTIADLAGAGVVADAHLAAAAALNDRSFEREMTA
jgi:magnesium chelatase family protein